jgi:hypothetical protein
MRLLEELKRIPELLIEVSVKQLKKQNPNYANDIDELIDQGVENKYLQWAVIQLKNTKWVNSQYSYASIYSKLYRIADDFEELTKKGKFKKAIKMKLINQKEADISYWHKKSFDDIEEFIERIESYNFESRKDIKAADSDLVYKDDRVVMYSPGTHKASCILGANTKWCISGSGTYFDDYTAEGKRFVFVIDRVVSPDDEPLAKIAMVYNVFEKDLDEMYDAEDDTVGYLEVIEHYDKKYWDKLKKEADSYIRNKKFEVKRADGDIWYGDRVAYGDWYINDIQSGYGDIPDKWKPFKEFLSDFFNDFVGEVIDPMRVNTEEDHDVQVTVQWEVPNRKDELEDEMKNLLKDLIVDEPEEPEELSLDFEVPEIPDRNDFDNDEDYDKAVKNYEDEYERIDDIISDYQEKYNKWKNDQYKVEELQDAYEDIMKTVDGGDYHEEEYVYRLEVIDWNDDLESVVKKFRG